MTTVQAVEDIFDRVEKKMAANPKLKERVPVLNEYVPPKPVEIPKEVISFVRGEIVRSIPKKVEARVIEKGPDEKKINGLIEHAVSRFVSGMDSMKAEILKKDQTITEMRKEYEQLRSELAKMREDSGVFIVQNPLPIQENKNMQFLTTDGRNARWGPVYINGTDPVIPIGDQTRNGAWRIISKSSDGSLSVQKLESGTWNEKGGYL